MQKREKILAAIVGALVLIVVGNFALGQYLDLFTSRNARLSEIQDQVNKKQAAIAKAHGAEKRLKEYRARSLPARRDLATSLYQNWLLSLLEGSKISKPVLSSQPPIHLEAFDRMTYNINGQATCEQLAKFLYDFYSASHMQKIQFFTVHPAAGGQLEFSLGIEALIVAGADRKDKLSDVASHRLALDDFAKYKTSLVGRNFFAEYVPPRSPERAKPTFDVAKHAFLTAIIEDDGQPQIWVTVRTTGQTLKLREGDSFNVGGVSGKVAHISERAVELDAGGKRLMLALGENLRNATAVASDAR